MSLSYVEYMEGYACTFIEAQKFYRRVIFRHPTKEMDDVRMFFRDGMWYCNPDFCKNKDV